MNLSKLDRDGFQILTNVYSDKEIEGILNCLTQSKNDSLNVSKDIFAIRQLLTNVPDLMEHLFNHNLKEIISSFPLGNYFLTKAIYFDKPANSNWFVAFHQDLSISVDQRTELDSYSKWTFKKGQHGVQPPIEILQDTITLRIHLDDTTSGNGALRVIPKSHIKGIIRPESEDWNTDNEFICEVEKGATMLMKPLTLHASKRTTNYKPRRVIHLEFCNHELPNPINWLEKITVDLQ